MKTIKQAASCLGLSALLCVGIAGARLQAAPDAPVAPSQAKAPVSPDDTFVVHTLSPAEALPEVPVPPQSVPPNGTVASYRLGEEAAIFLRAASRVRASHVAIQFAPPDRTRRVVSSEKEQGADFAKSLAALLLDERTYAWNANRRDPQGEVRRFPFAPTVLLRIWAGDDEDRYMDIEITPETQQMSFGASWARVWPLEIADYTLVAPAMVALLKRAFPDDPKIQALVPTRAASLPIPAQIPSDVRARTATLRPGMTRADLLKLFETEGGISTRWQHTYVFRGVRIPTQAVADQPLIGLSPGRVGNDWQMVKVDVEFAPATARVRWVEGAGILVDPKDIYRFGDNDQPDDVILSISPPRLGRPVYD